MASQAELNAINAAIASGVTKVVYDGVETNYRTLQEMREIRDELKVELGMVTPTREPYRPAFAKGYR